MQTEKSFTEIAKVEVSTMKLIDVERRKTGVFIKAIDRKLAKTLVQILADLLNAAEYLVSSVPEPGQKQKTRTFVKQRLKEYDQRAVAVYARFLFHLEHDYEMTRDEARKKTQEELGLDMVDVRHYLTRGREIEKEKEVKRKTALARRAETTPKKPKHSKRWQRLTPSLRGKKKKRYEKVLVQKMAETPKPLANTGTAPGDPSRGVLKESTE